MMETKARMRAAVFGICVNLCLFMVKLYVGISTNSISIYVDSLNNALDSVVCIIALVGFWLSVRTSPKYPFGLGRAEDLTGFITAVVIVGTGFGFGYVSLERTLYPAPVWFSVRYAVIIAVTAVVKLLLGAYYKFQGSAPSVAGAERAVYGQRAGLLHHLVHSDLLYPDPGCRGTGGRLLWYCHQRGVADQRR